MPAEDRAQLRNRHATRVRRCDHLSRHSVRRAPQRQGHFDRVAGPRCHVGEHGQRARRM